jgi:release factor glutamine methyltransferase
MDIQTGLSWATKKLKNGGSPALDTEVLLCHVLNKNKAFLYANPRKKLTNLQATSYKLAINKRTRGWPVAYLTGHKEFFGLDFLVTPAVLIPRPETELLVDLALQIFKSKIFDLKSIIDVGTGSGNIIVSLARLIKNPKIKFFAIDSSASALKIAKLNARLLGVYKKIRFLQGNLLTPLLQATSYNLQASLIVANLPYGWGKWKNNSTAETADLKFEPKNALFTGEKGLKLIRNLLYEAAKDRIGASVVLIEFDPRQKQAVWRISKKYFPRTKPEFHKDLSGRFRVLEICQK